MARKSDQIEKGRAFFRRVASDGAFAPVFLIHGPERFLVEEAIHRLVQSIFPSGKDDFNMQVLHGSEAKGIDVVGAAEMIPMFGSHRVVVLRGLDAMKAAEVELIAEYVGNPLSSTLLVLEALKLDKRTKAVQRLTRAKQCEAVEFPELWERDVVKWVARRARGKDLVLAHDVPPYLVEAVGTSLQTLDLTLDRIDLYLGESEETRKVTLEVLHEIVPDTRIRSVFELIDSLAERKLDDAMRHFHRMLLHGESPVGIVSLIDRQFRQLWLIREGVGRGLSDRELAGYAGCPPFRVRDNKRAARRFDDTKLRQVLRRVMETDHALKSSRLADHLLVERLFVEICR